MSLQDRQDTANLWHELRERNSALERFAAEPPPEVLRAAAEERAAQRAAWAELVEFLETVQSPQPDSETK